MDSFWDKVKKGAQEAGEKASILAKITKLQAEIAGNNTSKSSKIGDLGRKVYSLVKEGKVPDELKSLLMDAISPIEEIEKNIAQKEAEIAELKKQMSEEKQTPEVTHKEEKTEEKPSEEKPKEDKPEGS